MPDVFIVDLFIFKLTKISSYFAAFESTFLQVCQNIPNT